MSNVTNPLDHTRLYPEIWIRILAEISHEPQTFMLVRPEMTAKGHWLRLLPSRDHHVEVFELGRWGYWCSGCGSNDILNVAQVCHNWRNEIQRYRTRAFQVSGYRTEEKSPSRIFVNFEIDTIIMSEDVLALDAQIEITHWNRIKKLCLLKDSLYSLSRQKELSDPTIPFSDDRLKELSLHDNMIMYSWDAFLEHQKKPAGLLQIGPMTRLDSFRAEIKEQTLSDAETSIKKVIILPRGQKPPVAMIKVILECLLTIQVVLPFFAVLFAYIGIVAVLLFMLFNYLCNYFFKTSEIKPPGSTATSTPEFTSIALIASTIVLMVNRTLPTANFTPIPSATIKRELR